MIYKAFFIIRLNDHVQYLKKIDAAIRGLSNFEGTDHYQCKLGRWLYGEGQQEIIAMQSQKAKEIFESLFQPHERFHYWAHKALERKQVHDEEGTKQAMTELYICSTLLSNKLLELDKLN